jgi:hypothetical protein
MRELISETEQDGFQIRFYIMPEESAPEDNIATGNDALDREWCEKIRSGELQWFTACVTASRHGLELGADYLGCCDYADPADFMEELYYSDMVDAAIYEARQKIRALCREAA